jgi:hypothetical protein
LDLYLFSNMQQKVVQNSSLLSTCKWVYDLIFFKAKLHFWPANFHKLAILAP